jgi:hypothetical protein
MQKQERVEKLLSKDTFRRLFVIFIILLATTSLNISGAAQTKSPDLNDKGNQNENLINDVRIDFLLDPLLPLSEIGFDNPKSYWKGEYELFLTETSEIEKIGRCRRDETQRLICPLIIKKKDRRKYRKQIKPKLIKIAQGNFRKNNLSEKSNRDFPLLIPLSPEVIKIINDSQSSGGIPALVLFRKTKFYLKNSQNQKFKETRRGDDVIPLITYFQGKKLPTFDANTKIVHYGYGIDKSPGGRIMSIPYGR